MFGNNDQDQNSDAQAMPAADTPPADISVKANVIASAQSAPTIPDPITSSPTVAPMTTGAPDSTTASQDLAQIRQQVLQSLEPLVGHLDQAPDEKFKTVMMLIQSSDNSKMLKEAYAAASQITDEKVRAQALLDIVNEINYFTAQAQNKQQ